MSRENIRQAFKTAIETVYSGTIFTTRVRDSRDESEFISIYVSAGDVGHNMSGTETEARLHIKYSLQNATDAQLDAVMAGVESAIEASSEIVAAACRPLLESFEYSEDLDDIASITYTYRVIY